MTQTTPPTFAESLAGLARLAEKASQMSGTEIQQNLESLIDHFANEFNSPGSRMMSPAPAASSPANELYPCTVLEVDFQKNQVVLQMTGDYRVCKHMVLGQGVAPQNGPAGE